MPDKETSWPIENHVVSTEEENRVVIVSKFLINKTAKVKVQIITTKRVSNDTDLLGACCIVYSLPYQVNKGFLEGGTALFLKFIGISKQGKIFETQPSQYCEVMSKLYRRFLIHKVRT